MASSPRISAESAELAPSIGNMLLVGHREEDFFLICALLEQIRPTLTVSLDHAPFDRRGESQAAAETLWADSLPLRDGGNPWRCTRASGSSLGRRIVAQAFACGRGILVNRKKNGDALTVVKEHGSTIHPCHFRCRDAQDELRTVGQGIGSPLSGNKIPLRLRLPRKNGHRSQRSRLRRKLPTEAIHVETARR